MPRFKQLAPEDREAIAEWLLALDQPIEKPVERTEPEIVAAPGLTGPPKQS